MAVDKHNAEEQVRLLEKIARLFYPGMYVLVNEPMDEIPACRGLTASIIASSSADFSPENIRAVALVGEYPGFSGTLPETWQNFLGRAVEFPWDIDLFVPAQAVASIRRQAARINPKVNVFLIP